MISKIETLVDAIGDLNGIGDPLSDAYRLKNPLLCKSFGRPGMHEIDSEGRRTFNSLISGYRACLFDVALKVEGRSRAKLKPEDHLVNLLGSYGIKGAGPIGQIVKFLRKSLSDQSISEHTLLSFFAEK